MAKMTLESKLAESGLDPKDARLLGIKTLTAKQTAKLQSHYRDQAALYIPYFDVQGKPLDFYRIRYLESLGAFEQGRKYDGPGGHPPRAYFPKLVRWEKVVGDASLPITITEGEFKAACACKKGILAIGLGGVWNWRSKATGVEFLPELEAFEWKNRPVELCFDSDIVVKPQVRMALLSLTHELARRHAAVKLVVLPQQGEAKVGLDDFLVAEGVAAYRKLDRVPIHQTDERRTAFASRYIYLRSLDWVYDLEERSSFMSRHHFVNATGAERILMPDGKQRSLAAEWYTDPDRISVPGFVFEPALPQGIILGRGVNLFQGWSVVPRQGKVEPMLQLVDHLVGKRPEIRKWLLQWLAYPLQHPGAKLHSCVFVYGLQGHGKSALGLVMNDIYGAHSKTLNDQNVFGSWNEWLENALFGLCDELPFDGSKQSRSMFKQIITSEELVLSAKYRKPTPVKNRCNFYFTSNSSGGLPLEPGTNRRALVLGVEGRREDAWYAWMTTEFDAWRKQEGARYWLWYLLHRVDLEGFRPHMDAPTTEEERFAVESSGSSLELWLKDALPRAPLDRSDIWASREILEVYSTQMDDRRTGAAAISRALGQIPEAGRIRPIWVEGKLEQSLWAIRNGERWRKAKPKEILAEWQKGRFPGAPTV